MEQLQQLASLELPLIATGIGGSGHLMMRQTVKDILSHRNNKGATGLDLSISYYFSDKTYRYYMNINVHLYEGSLLDEGRSDAAKHGRVQSNEYPACFEVACQNFQASGVGNMDWYNLTQCRGIVEKSSDTIGCLHERVPQVTQRPICGHFCKTRCHDFEHYLLLQT
jgi:hypothetical protein